MNLVLRPVTLADAQLLHAWRNDPATRAGSRSSDTVSLSSHIAWLTKVLASSNYIIRIAEAGGKPVGVVRADKIAEGWELSWTVAPDRRRQGIGPRMVAMFASGL